VDSFSAIGREALGNVATLTVASLSHQWHTYLGKNEKTFQKSASIHP
jgi:hypothetical protein